MSNFKIFLQSGKLMIGEFPEQPEFKGDYFLHYGPQKQYEAAVEAAKASAVEVLSENCDNVFGARCLRGTNNEILIEFEEGQLYDLPAGWKVDYGYEWGGDAQTARLITVSAENAQPEKGASDDYPVIASSNADTGGDNPRVIFNEDSPVIPEGSEKHDFCLPWTYQERADKYTHIIRGNSNQHLLQGRQRPDGYEEALFRMIVKAVNAYHSADKPAIDDTLKGRLTEEELIDRLLRGKISPLLMNAGDPRVLVNGNPLPVDFRILSEDNYKLLMSAAAQPSPQAESQQDLWASIIAHTPYEPSDLNRKFLIDTLSTKFTISRKT